MEELIKRENRYQVKFNDETGYCKLIDKKSGWTKEFADVSIMVNYCNSKGIVVAIEDCVTSTVKNY